jgi:hypothetical protein
MVPRETRLPSGPRWFNIDVAFRDTASSVSIGILPAVGSREEEDGGRLHTSSMAATKPHIPRRRGSVDDDMANEGGVAARGAWLRSSRLLARCSPAEERSIVNLGRCLDVIYVLPF